VAAVGQLTKDGRGSSSLWRLLAGNRLAALPHHVLDRAKKGGVSLGSLRVGSQETGLVGVVTVNGWHQQLPRMTGGCRTGTGTGTLTD
jgi:hypothetical protein